jgi:hypothetical protein
MLNGYDIQNKMRKARRRYALSAQAQALCMELMAINNEEGWTEEFTCSNRELENALSVNEKSLIKYRNELITAKLIFYKSGKSQKVFGIYSFDDILIDNYWKFYSQLDSQVDSQSGSEDDSQLAENLTDNNKTETKRETETKKDSIPVKKPVKKKAGKPVTLFWKSFTETWFNFYQAKFAFKPTFEGAQTKALKSIVEKLEKQAKDKSFEWNEESALTSFSCFLNKAFQDQWLQTNFLLPVLSSKFDAIVNRNKNNNPSNRADISKVISPTKNYAVAL